ncbi:MAG: high frequency lysogenization protein HflD [Campylobacterota bacterium]|nr:high frequency lysogenization protein HflD [Campylobacterota bacterium]
MEIYNTILKQLVLWQYQINSYISTTIRSIDDENSLAGSLLVITIAFLYGVVHAAGPGHGKALVSFYFINDKEQSYKKAFQMGYLISAIHATSALIITFGIYFIVQKMFRQNFNEVSSIAMSISSVMIILVGFFLLYKAIKDKNDKEIEFTNRSNRSQLAVAFSAGIIPCPGVMTIVLFCIMLKHFVLGVVAAIFMSIGMGLTISLAGILTVLFRKKTTNIIESKGFYFEIFGACLIIILGLFLFKINTF